MNKTLNHIEISQLKRVALDQGHAVDAGNLVVVVDVASTGEF